MSNKLSLVDFRIGFIYLNYDQRKTNGYNCIAVYSLFLIMKLYVTLGTHR